MRRALQIVGLGAIALVLAVGGVVLSAPSWDGPLSRIPGGALRGQPYAGPEPDWSFVAKIPTVELQVDPAEPHSVRIAVLERGGQVFVPATLRPESKRWSQTLLDDPRALLRVDGRLYARIAERVEDPALFGALIELATQKYGPAYFTPETTWFFRLRGTGS